MLEWNRLGQTPQEIRAKLPACYSQQFDECIQEQDRADRENRAPKPSAYCDKYYSIIRDTSRDVFEQVVDLMPYCPDPTGAEKIDRKFPWVPLGVIAGIGGALAIVVAATGARF